MLRNLLARWLRSIARHSDDSVPAAKISGFLERFTPMAEIFEEQRSHIFSMWKSERPELPDGKRLIKNGLKMNTGLILDWYLQNGTNDEQILVKQIAEQLLRSVEIKRKSSLKPDPPVSAMETWREKQSIAIFFSHMAVKQKDLRFLNATLKINDWAFPFYRDRMILPRSAVFAYSLQEQENALQRLLP